MAVFVGFLEFFRLPSFSAATYIGLDFMMFILLISYEWKCINFILYYGFFFLATYFLLSVLFLSYKLHTYACKIDILKKIKKIKTK